MFRPTLTALSKKSSQAWVARQGRDHFVKLRVASQFKSRSAFKLIELDDQLDFLKHPDVNVVVDLGASPGGWSQVVSQRLGYGDGTQLEPEEDEHVTRETFKPRPKKKRIMPSLPGSAYDPLNIDTIEHEIAQRERAGHGFIVAVDLLPIGTIPGVRSVRGDFLQPEVNREIQELIWRRTKRDLPGPVSEARVDVVLSDMAPNISGHAIRDMELSYDLCMAVLNFAKRNLRAAHEIGRPMGGALVLKNFASNAMAEFRREHLEPYFHTVHSVKPQSSRSESSESYLVCRGWQPADGFRPSFGFL
ncbi:23S ribosomal RNA methyltransferase [Cylindrobasidium torrendii FP15055 ss-10]|uniref:rRNA methyltransferase 2, mitochondrial n=1 Tax=Cylindrobasidium torrendii FP15055 ss-10 TaxID=1314674 RepID=A0A0D7BH54_9AGAR|nr:23S ribosomal RNA methyltransferase [Cylindrobasidium torrendii FP15055 ss-10]